MLGREMVLPLGWGRLHSQGQLPICVSGGFRPRLLPTKYWPQEDTQIVCSSGIVSVYLTHFDDFVSANVLLGFATVLLSD